MNYIAKIVSGGAELCIAEKSEYSLNFHNFKLERCSFDIYLNNSEKLDLNWQLKSSCEECVVLVSENSLGAFAITFRATENRSGVKGFAIKVNATLNNPCRELNFALFQAKNIELDHLFTQGSKMGSSNLVNFPIAEEKSCIGEALMMLTKGSDHLFFSTPLQQKITSRIVADCQDKKLSHVSTYFDTLHWDNLEFESDELTILGSADPFKMITDWADDNTGEKKDFSQKPEYGWNSWDYYRWTITEDEVLKNAEAIAKDPVLSKHVKRIIVDDGWQYCYGEWEANPLFPNGMEYLAKELKNMGFKPGLWFAPTIVEPHARIAQSQGDMLGLNEGGQPTLCYSCMERKGFVLDPTSPKARKYIYDVFDRYASMGYEYFKLDFMGSTFSAPQFHDRRVPRSALAKMIVEPIYEAVAGRAEILGCNYRYEGGNSYVDAVRMGSDIHSRWDCICSNVVAVAGSFYSNKRWWLNDPDFSLCRGLDTSKDKEINSIRPCWVFAKPNAEYDAHIDYCLVDINISIVA